MSLYSIQTQGELHPFLSYEWLLTNGMGAFASSTVVGCNTRRYHGLLCAATLPPVGRVMGLNRIGELVYLDGKAEFLELSINQFRSNLHPRGERYLRTFDLGKTARWVYDVEGVKIVREVLLERGRNTVEIRYEIGAPAGRKVEMHLLPFVSLRDFHALRRAEGTQFRVELDEAGMTVRGEGSGFGVRGSGGPGSMLRMRAHAGVFQRTGDWWYGHTYAVESERGLDDTEDLFVPGRLIHAVEGSGMISLVATMEEQGETARKRGEEPPPCPPPEDSPHPALPRSTGRGEERGGEEKRAEEEGKAPSIALQRLLHAAEAFVVARRRPDGKAGTTIIAGYPWFADWGRDTFISLPGLLLTTRRFGEAAQVLSLFAEYVSEGMIPNKFDDYTNEPSYNTVDASLWFIHAAFEYLRLSGDRGMFEAKLLPACRAIVKGYRQGTRFNIAMDPADGLIAAGDEQTQLTWMDAKCEGIAFTPRHGKAVEINALWYNALCLVGEEELASRVRKSFVQAFWLNPFRGLCDVVAGGKRDESIRPNQIFAVSLPHSPLDEDQKRAVVEVVRRELLTPFGLRTLAKSDPHYRGRYRGGPMERDRAYHNGTVWPWLIGPFLEGHLRANRRSPDAIRSARVWLQPLIDHMNQGCIGQISECFEGDEPHRPVGAPAQAWSVAEVLRMAGELGI